MPRGSCLGTTAAAGQHRDTTQGIPAGSVCISAIPSDVGVARAGLWLCLSRAGPGRALSVLGWLRAGRDLLRSTALQRRAFSTWRQLIFLSLRVGDGAGSGGRAPRPAQSCTQHPQGQPAASASSSASTGISDKRKGVHEPSVVKQRPNERVGLARLAVAVILCRV